MWNIDQFQYVVFNGDVHFMFFGPGRPLFGKFCPTT